MDDNRFKVFDLFEYPVETAHIKFVHDEKTNYWELVIECGQLIKSNAIDEEEYQDMVSQPSPHLNVQVYGSIEVQTRTFNITSKDHQYIYVDGEHWTIVESDFELTKSEGCFTLVASGQFKSNSEKYPFSIRASVVPKG